MKKILLENGTVKYGIQYYRVLELKENQVLLMISKKPTWVDIKELN
jgi:hypothetical protein